MAKTHTPSRYETKGWWEKLESGIAKSAEGGGLAVAIVAATAMATGQRTRCSKPTQTPRPGS